MYHNFGAEDALKQGNVYVSRRLQGSILCCPLLLFRIFTSWRKARCTLTILWISIPISTRLKLRIKQLMPSVSFILSQCLAKEPANIFCKRAAKLAFPAMSCIRSRQLQCRLSLSTILSPRKLRHIQSLSALRRCIPALMTLHRRWIV